MLSRDLDRIGHASVGSGRDPLPRGDGVTQLLRRWSQGDGAALDDFAPIVHDELRRLAARCLRKERPGHTLSPTELVSEAFVRLIGGDQPEWTDRVHFFGVAARLMRQVLVDHARRRGARKRGAGETPLRFDETLWSNERSADLVALDDALGRLAVQDARKARVVEMHYFGGMTQQEIAWALGVHANTVARDLRLAEAWLLRDLQTEP